MSVRILVGDVRDRLRDLPDESVHCIVTSPPYFGLRDYGMPGQIGLEPTPAEFVETMVEVFREARRVLRPDGTLWLNLGDSYFSNDRQTSRNDTERETPGGKGGSFRGGARRSLGKARQVLAHEINTETGVIEVFFKPKDMIGIPWRVAFALQADGWWLRQDIIWHKPNPMPESVTDRCTKAHEYLFLLTKSERYFFDGASIAEPVESGPSDIRKMLESKERIGGKHKTLDDPFSKASAHTNIGRKRSVGNGETRNKRSVWDVATAPFPGAHFATFPPALIEPCIKAGCLEGGTVLDPFGGAGTTGLVADRLGRNAVLIELNPTYAEMAARRLRTDGGMFMSVSVDAQMKAAE